jgi:hypothetical protein
VTFVAPALLVVACVLSLCALGAAGYAAAMVLQATPIKLLGRQNELETSVEAALRASMRLENAWTEFLAENEGIQETLRDQIRSINAKRSVLAMAQQRAEQRANGAASQEEESLEQFELRMRRGG